jgi:small subunit ribosomal protein S20
MNKKQRNRKLIAQNKRNRIINRRYISTIKNLSKFFSRKVKSINEDDTQNDQIEKKNQVQPILNNLYSIIDKSVKKRVIHKNTASRKKSKLFQIFSTL